jgi:hypothetical protein
MSLFRIPFFSTIFYGINAYFTRYMGRNQISLGLSSISQLRKEYSRKGLIETELPLEPFSLFQNWFQEACNSNVLEPNAMCLSTCKVSEISPKT